MARKTNKELVLTLAAALGVEVEYGHTTDGFEVALYGYDGRMAFDPFGEGHTAITNQANTGARTEARVWGMALEDLRQYVPCADGCHCYADAALTTHYHNLTGDPSATDAELTPCNELPHCPSVCDCPAGACTALAAPVAAPAYVIHGDYYAPDADIDGPDPEILTHYAVAFANTEAEARELVADLTLTRPDVDWYSVPQDDEDLIVVDDTPDPVPAITDPDTVTTRYYVITDDDTDAEHTGSVIGNCAEVEAMRTMVGIVNGVSRDSVRIWETDNYREYGFDTPHGHRGTARFLSVVETPLNPYK